MDRTWRLDVISDAICPWCWIGKHRMERAIALLEPEGFRFEVHWRPYQLNPDMPPEGVARAAYRAAKFGSLERSRQLDAQVAAAGREVGLQFRHDLMARTPNTIAAHRLIRWGGNAVVEPLFHAYFHAGRDIGDAETLAAIAGEAGLDPAAAASMLAGTEGEAEVRAEEAEFRRVGIDGVPSFALEGHVLFSGAMPEDRMADAFRRAAGILARAA
ncbi:MAG: DsbA family oxidoreductase [Acetobacteraceae bacterium]|nr:DsbA family oxidoreductase [Acetobacteraceae bacterium]